MEIKRDIHLRKLIDSKQMDWRDRHHLTRKDFDTQKKNPIKFLKKNENSLIIQKNAVLTRCLTSIKQF